MLFMSALAWVTNMGDMVVSHMGDIVVTSMVPGIVSGLLLSHKLVDAHASLGCFPLQFGIALRVHHSNETLGIQTSFEGLSRPSIVPASVLLTHMPAIPI